MPSMCHHRFGSLSLGLLLLTALGCASTDDLEGPSAQLSFIQVKADPDSYTGQPVTFGGEVLSARRLKEGTRIEVLQLPLTSSQQPILDRTLSQGRFIAMQRDFLDPATIPPGTLVTVTGHLAGSVKLALDETDYTYPMVEIKHLQVRPPREERIRPYWGPGPYGSPFWSPYRRPWPYW